MHRGIYRTALPPGHGHCGSSGRNVPKAQELEYLVPSWGCCVAQAGLGGSALLEEQCHGRWALRFQFALPALAYGKCVYSQLYAGLPCLLSTAMFSYHDDHSYSSGTMFQNKLFLLDAALIMSLGQSHRREE